MQQGCFFRQNHTVRVEAPGSGAVIATDLKKVQPRCGELVSTEGAASELPAVRLSDERSLELQKRLII